jgi:hypothetical protein
MTSIIIEICRDFEEVYSLDLQGRIVSQATIKKHEALCSLVVIVIQFNSQFLCANSRTTEANYRELNK